VHGLRLIVASSLSAWQSISSVCVLQHLQLGHRLLLLLDAAWREQPARLLLLEAVLQLRPCQTFLMICAEAVQL
jgi:hypothetical protein